MSYTSTTVPDIRVPLIGNSLLKQVVERVNKHPEIKTLWRVNNVNAIDRLGITDHGPIHFQIVANIALRIARILHKKGIEMSITTNYKLSLHYAELVVFLASVLHDIGMSIDRVGHEELGLALSSPILRDILDFLPPAERVILTSDILHAIYNHRADGMPITIEAGIVRIADALDMGKGRSRIPYEAGKINIHSLSASAIEKVDIAEGREKPIAITIYMNNSAGIFQIDDLLKEKLAHSGIEKHFEIKALIEQENETSLIKEFRVE